VRGERIPPLRGVSPHDHGERRHRARQAGPDPRVISHLRSSRLVRREAEEAEEYADDDERRPPTSKRTQPLIVSADASCLDHHRDEQQAEQRCRRPEKGVERAGPRYVAEVAFA
jgi:hypothetical protein